MKVKELIKLLEKEDQEKDVVIRFALSNEDDTGYVLLPYLTGNYGSSTAIYAEYIATKEACNFVGQFDLKTLWENEYKRMGEK